jgi:hypothetical protein
MKIRPLPMTLAILAVTAAGALALSAAPVAADATARPVLGVQPDACVCSRGVNLGGERSVASMLYNCQCGAMQCVVHGQSGQLQCR